MAEEQSFENHMACDRFGDPEKLPTLSLLEFLADGHVDRVASLVMTLAAEVWALREEVAQLSGGTPPAPEERRAFVQRLLDAAAPEQDPSQPVRELAQRAPGTGSSS